MAGKQIASELQEEVTCPICMDILKEPVTIDCGHNFCLECIRQVGKAADSLLCPLCKASVKGKTFRPNKLLASLARKIQALDPADIQPEDGELRCKKHREKLHYFCEKDKQLLCLVCRDSKEHRSHSLSLIEEAVEKYQEQIQTELQLLKQKEKEIEEETQRGRGKIAVFTARVHLERLKIQEEFKHLRKSLEEEESFLLARLLWMENKGDKMMQQYDTVIEEQLRSLRKITWSLTAKQKMPPSDLLQDTSVTSTSSDGFQFTSPTPVPVDLEGRINEARSRHESTIESVKQSIENLKAHMKQDKDIFNKSMTSEDRENFQLCLLWENNFESPPSAPVTLNAASADPDLTLSQDLKKVSLYLFGGGARNTQAKPRPFYPFHCVLGSQGLSSGRQAWEVDLRGSKNGACVVGVATELTPRPNSENNIWALKVSASECQPITKNSAGQNLPILLSQVVVYLDRDQGKVVFFDPTTNQHIYTFQDFFTGAVFPFFGLLKACSHITLSP